MTVAHIPTLIALMINLFAFQLSLRFFYYFAKSFLCLNFHVYRKIYAQIPTSLANFKWMNSSLDFEIVYKLHILVAL